MGDVNRLSCVLKSHYERLGELKNQNFSFFNSKKKILIFYLKS